MTRTFALQSVTFTLAAIVTSATLLGVDGVAAQQRVASAARATQQAPMQTVAVQNVVVIGHRIQRA